MKAAFQRANVKVLQPRDVAVSLHHNGYADTQQGCRQIGLWNFSKKAFRQASTKNVCKSMQLKVSTSLHTMSQSRKNLEKIPHAKPARHSFAELGFDACQGVPPRAAVAAKHVVQHRRQLLQEYRMNAALTVNCLIPMMIVRRPQYQQDQRIWYFKHPCQDFTWYKSFGPSQTSYNGNSFCLRPSA